MEPDSDILNIAHMGINNGSVISFVAQRVVDKLHWFTEKLPNPYKVTWDNGSGILVYSHMFGIF